MKKHLAIFAALALALPGVAQAQGQSHTDQRQTEQSQTQNHGQQVSQAAHRFSQGQRFDRSKATNYRRVAYTENRRLSRPPSGQVWVRAGNDALLVRLSDNVVQRVVSGLF